ncbi:DUF1476 domain-containing protein [Nisaea acidiphila]|uniref:DUF1476 domain-containing protein n=1 Tax=Nisaea acidiphila TaxID=1862145 RepID=A0A9J7AW93_9PROT|nr:DUF1476 domain-containing protein [Nisaea acidiphila]UUX49701.1 DUF1476 domain-containing protein [Nisaea acidiphila]
MSGFDKRQKGEEAKFALDAELQFKASARRNKLLGLWVAETFLDKTGPDADAYAREVVAADMEKPGVDDVVEFVLKSVEGTGADLSEHRLRNKIDEFTALAVEQVKNEG